MGAATDCEDAVGCAGWSAANAGAKTNTDSNAMVFFIIPPPSNVKIGVQDAYLGNLRDRQLVAGRRVANRLGRGPVVNAEGPLAVRRNVGVDPSDAVLGVIVDDLTANIRADFILRNRQAVGKISFDQIAGH